MDSFAERYLAVEGRTFLTRSGRWVCELDRPVDASGVDRRVFHFYFNQIHANPRWTRPTIVTRKLELRTSLQGFLSDPVYAGWLRLVIDGFLDSGKAEHMQEAYEVERAP